MNGPHETRREVGRIGRFIVIGLGSVAIDFFVFRWLSASLPGDAAKAASYVAGMLFGFVGNKFWAFRSARKSVSEPLVYAGLYAVTLGVNVGVNKMVLAVLGESAGVFAFFAATGTTTVLNYLGMRWLAFRKGIQESAAIEDVKPEHIRRAA